MQHASVDDVLICADEASRMQGLGDGLALPEQIAEQPAKESHDDLHAKQGTILLSVDNAANQEITACTKGRRIAQAVLADLPYSSHTLQDLLTSRHTLLSAIRAAHKAWR